MLSKRDYKIIPLKGYKTVSIKDLEDESSCTKQEESSKIGVSLKIMQRTKHPFAS